MQNLWIYSDADNTLWDTDGVFLQAQLQLLAAAERLTKRQGPYENRLSFVRRLDQAIATKHHSELRYPPLLLLRSLCFALSGAHEKDSVRKALVGGDLPTESEGEAIESYIAAINSLPPLLTGVKEGLKQARTESLPVFVITEGPLNIAKDRIKLHGLLGLISGVLSATKSVSLFRRLAEKATPSVTAMIGDQLDKDVRFAHKAGLLTVLIPSKFLPSWADAKDAKLADAVCTDYRDAIRWLISSMVG